MSFKQIVVVAFLLCFGWMYLGQFLPALVPNNPRLGQRVPGYSNNTRPQQRPGGQAAFKPTAPRTSQQDGGQQEGSTVHYWPVASHRITQGIHGHNAVDFGAEAGSYIYAYASGVVKIAKNDGRWNEEYGNYVVIAHPDGTETWYGHASRVLVSVGDRVEGGALIGTVGSTGNSTGPHLHFEVRGAPNPFGNLTVAQK